MLTQVCNEKVLHKHINFNFALNIYYIILTDIYCIFVFLWKSENLCCSRCFFFLLLFAPLLLSLSFSFDFGIVSCSFPCCLFSLIIIMHWCTLYNHGIDEFIQWQWFLWKCKRWINDETIHRNITYENNVKHYLMVTHTLLIIHT